MSYCINPHCPLPDHPGNAQQEKCSSCGSSLTLQGKYRVDRLISDKSGFGIIYAGHRGKHAKILKVLKEEHNKNSKAVELFCQEAQVLGRLYHAGIPKVDGYFPHRVAGGLVLHCISMEKIEGLNLEEWQKSQRFHPLAQEIALQWLKQIVEVLEVVHRQQYLHRDIKPANIMLTPTDRIVLIDFGTARDVTYSYLANIGQGIGMTSVVSAGYTAPEQMNGQAVQQSDFFSLGRTFVQLLTGKHPLDIYDPVNDVLEWRKHAPGLAPSFGDLIDQLMTRRPNQRPESARSLLKQLEVIERAVIRATAPPRVISAGSTPTLKATPPPFQVPWKVIGFLGCLVLMGLGAYLYGWPGFFVGGILGIFLASSASKITPLAIRLKHTFFAHAKTTTAVTFSADGLLLVTAGGDRSIKIWDTKTMQLRHTLVGHADWVYSLAMAPGGQLVISGSGDTTIKIWQSYSGQLIETLSEHELGVNALAMSADESYVVSGSADRTVKVWHLGTRQLLRTLKGHSQSVDAVILSDDGQQIMSGSADKTIKVWALQSGQVIRTITGHQDAIRALVLSLEGTVLFSCSNDQTVKAWDIHSGKLIRTFVGHQDKVNALVRHPKRPLLLSAGADRRIKIWHIPSGSLIHTLRGHAAAITSLGISEDGKWLVSGSADGSIKVWRF